MSWRKNCVCAVERISIAANRRYAAGIIFYEAEERGIIFPLPFNLDKKGQPATRQPLFLFPPQLVFMLGLC